MRGGADNDILHGGADNDTLIGGTGADILDGGDGKDKADYRYSAAAVTVNLATGTAAGGDAEGDTFSFIENIGGSQFDDTLSGNDENNALYGNGGADQLSGESGNDWMRGGAGNDILRGGTGRDTLFGEAGADTFVFDTVLDEESNLDKISDFTADEDIIQLNNSIFSELINEGELSTDNFHSGASNLAADENDYILYNSSSGSLLYDADGSGSGVAIEFAQLTSKPEISVRDFVIAS